MLKKLTCCSSSKGKSCLIWLELQSIFRVSLYFLDKPRFSEDEKKVFTVEEGGHLLINLTATANPPEITYEWTKNGKDGRAIPEVADALPESRAIGKFTWSSSCFRRAYSKVLYLLAALPGGFLNISQARREDAGMYKVRATNSIGKKNFKFQLDVHYAPK